MKKIHVFAFMLLAFGGSHAALAAVSNITGNGEGDTREAAVDNAEESLNESCESFGGTPVADSLEVTFEKSLSNGKVYVDATMQCDIP